ncbi:hypothetical protein [Vibrio pomeroyi]|uniref:hypothetical protein n=1 Tax=Vibrio pomeroyi TaxID=198832 RepID=UPI0021C3B260|nr:hypothetical protein [Vibrio pomeroyi]
MFFDAWIFAAWMAAIGQMLPSALLVFAVVAPIARLFVTKVLLEPINNERVECYYDNNRLFLLSYLVEWHLSGIMRSRNPWLLRGTE